MLPRLAACGYSNYHVLRATPLWLRFIKLVVPKVSLLSNVTLSLSLARLYVPQSLHLSTVFLAHVEVRLVPNDTYRTRIYLELHVIISSLPQSQFFSWQLLPSR